MVPRVLMMCIVRSYLLCVAVASDLVERDLVEPDLVEPDLVEAG